MSAELATTQIVSNANLKAYYRFESGALTTDSSGEGHTLTAISDPAENASGKFGGAVALDGNDAYSATDHADFKPTGNFTIGFWIKASDVPTAAAGIFQSGSVNTNQAGFKVYIDTSGRVLFRLSRNTGTTSGTDYITLTASSSVCDGNWYFIVCTWDGTNAIINRNGGSYTKTQAWEYACGYAATNYVRIGCLNNSGTDSGFFTGSLDDVFLLNGTALSTEQIASIWSGMANVKINIGDVWKDAIGMQINIGDAWKTITNTSINIGDAWKTIF